MVEAALIASYLCNLQPRPVRRKLLEDATFGARFGPVAQDIMTLDPDVHLARRKCYSAVRRAFADQRPVSLLDVEGDEILVKIEQGQVILEVPSRRRKAGVSDFTCLSPNHEERTRTLRQLIDRFGPTAPDFSALLTVAEERELSDDEVDELFAEATTGVAAFQRRATSAFTTHQATLKNLVPSSLMYYERFCGLNITSTDHEDYFRSLLPQYRKDLIRRDLVRGLDICLQGGLRDDLMPGPWVEHVNDDELWAALTACDPWSNPFALLGALDIALSRQHDERYRTFAEEAVRKLVQEELPRPDGIDVYEVLPLWAELVLNRINGLEGGALRPPCWKRMCAWMQAGFLVRVMQEISLELESFREWVKEWQTLAGMYAKVLDLRHEPMYHAAITSRKALREEVIGRLWLVRRRHEAAGHRVPGAQGIDEAVAMLTEQGSLGWELPGPLDAHCRPAERKMNRLPEDDIRKLSEALPNKPDALISALAYLSQLYDLGDELLAGIRAQIGQGASAREDTALDAALEQLIGAGIIACAQRDEGLADAIASLAMAIAPRAGSGFEISNILQALLIAGAAFQHEDAWAGWLEGRLADVASRLPAGEPSNVLLAHLQELKKALKLSLGIHVRAEALASAAR